MKTQDRMTDLKTQEFSPAPSCRRGPSRWNGDMQTIRSAARGAARSRVLRRTSEGGQFDEHCRPYAGNRSRGARDHRAWFRYPGRGPPARGRPAQLRPFYPYDRAKTNEDAVLAEQAFALSGKAEGNAAEFGKLRTVSLIVQPTIAQFKSDTIVNAMDENPGEFRKKEAGR